MELAAENICVKIGDKEILHDVSYKFAPAKRTAIIGPNGAGKSTLLKALCLLNENFSGHVTLDGKNIFEFGRRKISQVMAILPQEKEAPQDTTVRQLVDFHTENFFLPIQRKMPAQLKRRLKLLK